MIIPKLTLMLDKSCMSSRSVMKAVLCLWQYGRLRFAVVFIWEFDGACHLSLATRVSFFIVYRLSILVRISPDLN